jgi:peptidoglycan/LPS O-acetylase OafA/YrhL
MTDEGRGRHTPHAGRYPELDGLRGIAVLAVVIRHFTSTYDAFFADGPPPPFSFEEGRYGVQLFFLISGFVILMTARRAGGAVPFVIARFSRLYPPYWVALALTTLVVAVLGPELLRRTLGEVAVNTTMVQAALGVRHVDDSYWSLSVELLFYAIIALALWRSWADDRRIRWVMGAWVALGLVVGVIYFAGGRTPELWRLVILTGAEFPTLFATGVLAMQSRGRRLTPLLAPTLVAGIAISWLIIDLRHAVIVTALSVAFVALTRVPRIGALRSRPIQYLGAVSYPLYLTHQFIGYSIVHALVPSIGRVAAMVVAFALVLLASTVIHRVVEERASRALRRRLTSAWRARTTTTTSGEA